MMQNASYMGMRYATRRRRRDAKRDGVFDPDDASKVAVKHFGIWTLYEEIQRYDFQWQWPGVGTFVRTANAFKNTEYLARLVGELLADSPGRCVLYVFACLLSATLPAAGVWLSGQMLTVVQRAIDTRSVDERWLVYIVLGRWLCALTQQLANVLSQRSSVPIQKRLRMQFTRHILKAHLRIDVPTYNDTAITRQLESSFGRGNAEQAWGIISTIVRVVMSLVNFVTSLGVLSLLLWSHQESLPLAVVSIAGPLVSYWRGRYPRRNGGISDVYAATCSNPNYPRLVGLRNMATDAKYKQEVVAGALDTYIYDEFERAASEIGEDKIQDFWQAYEEAQSKERFLDFAKLSRSLFDQLPQIIFTLQVVRSPGSMPFTMASYSIIQTTVLSFTSQIFQLLHSSDNVANSLQTLKELYELGNIQNHVVDGSESYPENARETATQGVSVEFRNVSFIYPGSDTYALNNVSFKLERGSLCVIVGFNGSGKSTILKLITRLYDPTEGEILIDGRDIKTLKLADLRNIIATLFQDFAIYPLSIRDNIRMGDPRHAYDEDLVEAAAQQGGVMDFVDRLPGGLDTYIENPVPDVYSNLPEGTKQLFGKKVTFDAVRSHVKQSQDHPLSGGQSQKIAVSRTLMRAQGGKDRIGLLLFDEPSASLDPEAEYKLFDTLRTLRGNKSMIFSSHRFGNLTRHADLILYMKDSVIVESGTHEQLLAMEGGGYARMWNMQAQAFLP
ncbi:P-loop containing nucleoside triphosphate hydrolase protein [Exidia glandulosa HHB12029]|uniref:p-loop containing nucleoside triphosphate hydrolase protein n=1 Tax=Exidia glandulosa HHB12029 TaxID=1314781 RepID=A0A165PM97_EXIGL|nr:P-loop containing nucleoside triphosphate hydrolase protein [Exidia glandulosa HHB12029]